jgi:hypothetical protein
MFHLTTQSLCVEVAMGEETDRESYRIDIRRVCLRAFVSSPACGQF